MQPVPRTLWVDQLRGLAVVWMVAFHFCFDLDWLGFQSFDMLGDPWWTTQRTLIVTLFIWTAGLSQVLAVRGGQSPLGFWKRWSQIAGCALLVSVSSYLSFGASWIYFGVLHAVAVMLLLVRAALWLALPWWAWLAMGAAVIASAQGIPALLQATLASEVQVSLNNFPMNILGWISEKPITEDYVPLAPWLGVMCLGVAFALWRGVGRQPGHHGGSHAPVRNGRAAAQGSSDAATALRGWLAWTGRHSLLIYMVHQPVMVAFLKAIQALQ